MSDKTKPEARQKPEAPYPPEVAPPKRVRAPLTELQAMSRVCQLLNDLSIPQAERILAWLDATLQERKDAAKPKEPS